MRLIDQWLAELDEDEARERKRWGDWLFGAEWRDEPKSEPAPCAVCGRRDYEVLFYGKTPVCAAHAIGHALAPADE